VRRFPHLEPQLGRIGTHRVSRLRLEGPGGESTVIESSEPAALMVRRVEFDALLVSMAVEAGAELVTGADIVHASSDADGVRLLARDGRRFEAAAVVAADGVNSAVGRRLGINAGWPSSAVALDMMEETPRRSLRDIDPTSLWVAYGHDPGSREPHGRARGHASEGYAYVFPKRDHVNIGVGYVLDHYRRSVDARPYDLQRRVVNLLRDRGIVEGESVRENFTPFLIPVGGPLRRPAKGRVLLAGDAAGFVNGVTAEGIYYAMVSGELAARAILETQAGAERTVGDRYRRACDDEIGTELRDSVLIRRYLFGDRRRIAGLIAGAQCEPGLTRLVLEFFIGRVSYAHLRRRLLMTSPRLASRLFWERIRHVGRA
jgi:flavin-dependent dehydrogenase